MALRSRAERGPRFAFPGPAPLAPPLDNDNPQEHFVNNGPDFLHDHPCTEIKP